MANLGMNDYDLDYVYMPSDGAEFCSVHVSLQVSGALMIMTIVSETEMPNADLAAVLDGLLAGAFRKMQFQLGVDCIVVIQMNGTQYNAKFTDGDVCSVVLEKAVE